MTHPTDSNQDGQMIRDALQELPKEMIPKRDLWPEISQRLNQDSLPNSYQRESTASQGWMPYAVAASLLVAVSAMLFSWHTWEQYELFSQQQQARFEQQTLLNSLDNQHRLSKASFLQKLEHQTANMDPAVVADLINNVMVIEQALLDIKGALLLDPGNERLISLLKRTYEKQDTLISQTKKNYQTI